MALLREQDVEVQCLLILCSKWKKPPKRLTRPLLVSTLSYSLLHFIYIYRYIEICIFIFTKQATKVMRFRATLYHTIWVFVLLLAGKSSDMDVFFGQNIELIGECSIAIVWRVSLDIYIFIYLYAIVLLSFLRYLLLLCSIYVFFSFCLCFFLSLFLYITI